MVPTLRNPETQNKMSVLKKILDQIKGNEDLSEIKSSSFRDFLNGNLFTKKFFRKQILLIVIMFIFIFFYVDNRYYCEKQLYNIITLEKRIKDVKFESLTISAQLMKITRQSNILSMVKERGLDLQIPKNPAFLIDTVGQKNNTQNQISTIETQQNPE